MFERVLVQSDVSTTRKQENVRILPLKPTTGGSELPDFIPPQNLNPYSAHFHLNAVILHSAGARAGIQTLQVVILQEPSCTRAD